MKQKTLQEQYNLIKEGKGNTEVFMKAAKRQFPNIILNAATLDQTINGLKRNHIISESMLGLGMVADIKSSTQPDWFSIFNSNMENISEEAKVEEKKTTKEVEDLAEKNFNYKDDKNLDNLFGEEFLKGYYVEMKDPKNADKTVEELKTIVSKNLTKDKLFYVKDGQFGEKGVGYTEKEIEEVSGKYKPSGYSDKLKKSENKDILVKESLGEAAKPDFLDLDGDGDKEETMKKSAKDKKKKMKKESIDTKLAEIEKAGKAFVLEAQIEALAEIIESKNQRISMVSEDENLSGLVDSKKVKEMQKEIKLLEKQKSKLEKLYEKTCGKSYSKKEMVGEEMAEDAPKEFEAMVDKAEELYDELGTIDAVLKQIPSEYKLDIERHLKGAYGNE